MRALKCNTVRVLVDLAQTHTHTCVNQTGEHKAKGVKLGRGSGSRNDPAPPYQEGFEFDAQRDGNTPDEPARSSEVNRLSWANNIAHEQKKHC